jgi:hypothetical protein
MCKNYSQTYLYLFVEGFQTYLQKVFTSYLLTVYIRGPFEKFVDWRQCAAVMQREAVTVMVNFNDGGNVVVACSSSI